MSENPVHYLATPEKYPPGNHVDEVGWYFWDETWSNRHGPYPTKEEADAALKKYCEEYLG